MMKNTVKKKSTILYINLQYKKNFFLIKYLYYLIDKSKNKQN